MSEGERGEPLTVLIDDVRAFRDGRPALVARSSAEGLTLLASLAGRRIDDLWLDHDLVGRDTIAPVVEWMVSQAKAGAPVPVGVVHVHASRFVAAHEVRTALAAAGYPVRLSHDLGMWVRGS